VTHSKPYRQRNKWYVDVESPNGRTEQIGEFASDSEAQDRIIDKSGDWLRRQPAITHMAAAPLQREILCRGTKRNEAPPSSPWHAEEFSGGYVARDANGFDIRLGRSTEGRSRGGVVGHGASMLPNIRQPRHAGNLGVTARHMINALMTAPGGGDGQTATYS
jgi:hypothetical protein